MVIICQRPFDIEQDQLLCPENSFLHRDEEGQYRCISNRCLPLKPQDKKTPIVGIIVATLTGVFLVVFLLYFFLL